MLAVSSSHPCRHSLNRPLLSLMIRPARDCRVSNSNLLLQAAVVVLWSRGFIRQVCWVWDRTRNGFGQIYPANSVRCDEIRPESDFQSDKLDFCMNPSVPSLDLTPRAAASSSSSPSSAAASYPPPFSSLLPPRQLRLHHQIRAMRCQHCNDDDVLPEKKKAEITQHSTDIETERERGRERESKGWPWWPCTLARRGGEKAAASLC